MKNLMKAFSVVLFGILIIVLLSVLINVDSGFQQFGSKLVIIVIYNILPIVAISLCCFCLERGDQNVFLRIIPVYMLISIIISSILIFVYPSRFISYSILDSLLGLKTTAPSDFGTFLYGVYKFMSSPHLCLTLVSVLFMVQPNNVISGIMKKVAYTTIAINIIIAAALNIKSFTRNELQSIIDSDTSDIVSFQNYKVGDYGFLENVNLVSVIIESFSVVALFITNYAFSASKEYVSNDVDIDLLKERAAEYTMRKIPIVYDNSSNKPVQKMFTTEPREIVKDESQTGIMNISNQLGNNSNVGQVSERAENSVITINKTLNMEMPFSSGPVINDSLVPKQEVKEVQTEVQTTPITEPITEVKYQDIGELMKQNQQINNNNQNNI